VTKYVSFKWEKNYQFVNKEHLTGMNTFQRKRHYDYSIQRPVLEESLSIPHTEKVTGRQVQQHKGISVLTL